MSERERWMVYPLIFLTLGIALKDKLVEAIDAKYRNVFCNSLVVTDAKGRQQAIVSSDPEGGFVRAVGTKDGLIAILGHTDQFGGLMFIDRHGAISVNPGSVVQARRAPPVKEQKEVTPQQDATPDSAPEVPPPEAKTP